ncbi:MAG: PAS domain-containing sensor histidine kinase [Bacteroidia bacterium]
MEITIKKRIYLSFSLFVAIFVINGIITIAMLSYSKQQSKHISEVVDPSLQALNDFKIMLHQSQMNSTNWVFIRASDDDKKALLKIHSVDYPALRKRLSALSAKWYEKSMTNSLEDMFLGFEQVLHDEKYIIRSLHDFGDYDDLIKRFGAEEQLENSVIPRTNVLMNSLNKILIQEQEIRAEQEEKFNSSAAYLRILITSLCIGIIFLGINFSVYLSKIIINPINKIRDIVNDLGKGIIKKVERETINDEIGEMIYSVNNLSEKLEATATFAHEVGNRNYKIPFHPLSEEDTLGKALITMRDNIKSGDERLNEAQHIAQLGGWELDMITNTTIFSDEMLRILDVDPADTNYTYQTYVDAIHPDDLEHAHECSRKYLHDHQPISYECRIITQKGIQKVIHAEGKVVLNDQGEVVKTYGIVQDITARKKAEEAIAESEKKYRILFEKMVDGVYKSSHEGKFIDANPALVRMLGYDSKEELFAIDIKTELYFEASERDSVVQEVSTEGMDVYRLKKKDGSEIWVEDSGQYVTDENGVILYHEGILRDATERVKAEAALKESEIRFRSLIENSADMINLMDDKGRYIYVSPSVVKKFGYTYEEWLSMNAVDLMHQEDLLLRQALLAEVIQNPSIPMQSPQLRFKKKDGSYIWVEGTVTNLLHLEGTNAIVVNFRDITQRREDDEVLKNRNAELTKTNMELDKFVYSVSHDLRAPLLSMLGIVDITAMETTEELTGEHMKMLNGSINRLDTFIGEILNYSRNARGEVVNEIIDFKKLVGEITDDLKFISVEDRTVNIETNIKEEGMFYSDKRRISVVLNNLISNSIRYHNPAAVKPFVKINVIADGKNTKIEIEDNGIGIEEKFQEKVFEMFYRVSENSNGSGLGLYIVKETIEKLHGDIQIQSKEGIGTKFSLNIPNLYSDQ